MPPLEKTVLGGRLGKAIASYRDKNMHDCANALADVVQEVRALEQDAGRYRWLRERDLGAIRQGGIFAGQTPENMVLNGEDLDLAVDAAMRAAKPSNAHAQVRSRSAAE